MDTPIGKSTLGEMLPLFIIIGVLFLFIVFCIRMIIVTSKAKKKRKSKLNELKEEGLSIYTAFHHVNGLPVAENILCEVFSYTDRLEFKSGSMQFKLLKNKITDITIKTDVEIQNQYVSSIGGAVGGAVLFGPLGAMIGGRAKKKKTKIVNSYLIFTYKNEDEIKYIGFNVTNNIINANKFVKEFRQTNTETTTIDL